MTNLTGSLGVRNEINVDIIGTGARGKEGKSAYEIWLDLGNEGTEQEYLASLNGITPHIGPNGNWFVGDIDTSIKAEGQDGQGVPTGGTAGQKLVKVSDADFDTQWQDDFDTQWRDSFFIDAPTIVLEGVEKPEQGFYNNQGRWYAANNYRCYEYDVIGGQKYRVACFARYSAVGGVELDVDGNFIKYIGIANPDAIDSLTTQEFDIVVSDNCTKLCIEEQGATPRFVKSFGSVPTHKAILNGLLWTAVGDSLTSPNTLVSQAEKTNYVEQVAAITGINARNAGIGGSGYIGGSNVFSNRLRWIPAQSDIITIFGSFNDAKHSTNYTLGNLGDTTNDTLYGAFHHFYDLISTNYPNAIVGIITPTPWASEYRGHTIYGAEAIEYVTALQNFADYNSLPCLNLFDESGMRPWDATFKATNYLNGDGTHPLSNAHKRYITPKIADFITKIANGVK